jgi:hypothetical protein
VVPGAVARSLLLIFSCVVLFIMVKQEAGEEGEGWKLPTSASLVVEAFILASMLPKCLLICPGDDSRGTMDTRTGGFYWYRLRTLGLMPKNQNDVACESR